MKNNLRHRSHSVGQNAFHFVWKPKYSNKILQYELTNKVCQGTIKLIAYQYNCKIYELERWCFTINKIVETKVPAKK